nr:glycolipid transfer protein-like [Leptinotarsa decemlineata]
MNSPTHPFHEPTVFSTLPAHFPNASEKIKTKEFLEASSAAVTVIERFGKVFAPVINDMNGNVQKLLSRYEKDIEGNEYLEDMIVREQTEGENVATDALMWLRRALHFLSLFYQYLIEDSRNDQASSDLAPLLKKAYSETLKPFHGWLGSQLFNVLSRFAPRRKNLIFSLGLEKPNRDQDVMRDLETYNSKMMTCIRRLTDFYTE